MSTWGDLEAGIRAKLSALAGAGGALLKTVGGSVGRERRAWLAEASRTTLPAAWVVAGERRMQVGKGGGRLTVSVVIATASWRAANEARVGATSGDVVGVYGLAGAVAAGLERASVAGRRLRLLEESLLASDETAAVWEQTYEARIVAELAVPTFGGVELTGNASEVEVEVSPARLAVQTFSFPGVDGVWREPLGRRERPITWSGRLRASDDAGLSTLEAAIEAELLGGGEKTLSDAWGRSYAGCVLTKFERSGGRERDEATGWAEQAFTIVFEQVGG